MKHTGGGTRPSARRSHDPSHHRFLDRLQGSAQAGQDNIRFGILDIHHPVFPISVAVIAAFVIFALLQAGPTEAALNGIRGWLTSTFDWLFMGAANLFVLFSLFLIFSPMGSVVIGGQDAKPEYSFVGWTSMLFATGMGIGLVFFGVMEPMHHFNNPPLGLAPPLDAQGQLVAPAVAPARELAMAATVFHWGLHPWAIYAVVGLSLALITYNLRLPLSIRSVLYPILGLRHARRAGQRHRHTGRVRRAVRPGDFAGPRSRRWPACITCTASRSTRRTRSSW